MEGFFLKTVFQVVSAKTASSVRKVFFCISGSHLVSLCMWARGGKSTRTLSFSRSTDTDTVKEVHSESSQLMSCPLTKQMKNSLLFINMSKFNFWSVAGGPCFGLVGRYVQDSDCRMRGGRLCFCICDASCSNTVKVVGQCFPDTELFKIRYQPYYCHHLVAAVSIQPRFQKNKYSSKVQKMN